MKIKKIKIKNFRLLKDFQLDLEEDLSLVIGKNNCGKTSLLSILEKFIGAGRNKKDFYCDDFNIDFQKHLKKRVEDPSFIDDSFLGISLKLFIEYGAQDELSNVSKVIMDLDPANTTIVLAFEYALTKEALAEFRIAFKEFEREQTNKIDNKNSSNPPTNDEEKQVIEDFKAQKKKVLFYDFFKKEQKTFFDLFKKTLLFDLVTSLEKDDVYINLIAENINLDKIINFKVINARRDVSNKDNDKALSILSSNYYDKRQSLDRDSVAIQQFKETLTDTDDQLDIVYKGLFKNVVEKVEKFGGIKKGDSVIKIISTLQHRELLKGNTTVMYDHNDEHSLPEHYNGLGYMNLIGMIFEIEVLLTDFRKENKENENSADINLLFIEEPEAHTHPQMQYVFIKNIKDILSGASIGDDGTNASFSLQTIITTHSSHITAESKFSDIKYFSKTNTNHVIAKNLQDLEKEYANDGEIENFKFLKQYLTLNRAELFFADKAIFIEGDTERILLPAIMKKIDQDDPLNPLLSQNISIVEVGAYSHIFEKFIDFIGVKSLLISDIDSGKEVTKQTKTGKSIKVTEACPVEDPNAVVTTNASLKFFHSDVNDLQYFKDLHLSWKILRKRPRDKKWVSNKKGRVLLICQTKQVDSSGKVYHPRSFEDAFFHLNKSLLLENTAQYESLTKKYRIAFIKDLIDVYGFAEKAIGSKPSLAMEILLNSKSDSNNKLFTNWEIPFYIKEGLQWLKND